MREEELSNVVIACAIEVHRRRGSGVLESASQACFCHELETKGVHFQKEVPMPIVHKEVKLDHGFRMDILVEDNLVVELKTEDTFLEVHKAQLLIYAKAWRFPFRIANLLPSVGSQARYKTNDQLKKILAKLRAPLRNNLHLCPHIPT